MILPSNVRNLIPLNLRLTVLRFIDDRRSWLWFSLNQETRRRAYADYRSCQDASDYLQCARSWLGDGPLQQYEEIVPAIEYLSQSAPEVFCEIGTEHGGTTFLLGQALATVRIVVGVDLYIKNKAQLRLLKREDQRIHLLEGSSHSPRTFQRVERSLAGSGIDLLFIDGDHSYDGAARDFQMYSRLLHDGSQVVFHDIVMDHGQRFETDTLAWSGGVPKLWSLLKSLYESVEFIRDPEQDGMGLGILTYDRSVVLPAELARLARQAKRQEQVS